MHGWKKMNEKRYGVSPEQYDAMYEAQGGVCAICRTEGGSYRLAVDHDHATDQIRGLLCSNCNAAIGLLQDKPEYLSSALLYLERGGCHR